MAYKLVSQLHGCADEVAGKFRSITDDGASRAVIYEVDKPTYPKSGYGPLSAFRTLADVELFQRLHGWKWAALFRCRIVRDKKASGLWSFFPEGLHKRRRKDFSVLPEGTILCKSVTLTKRLDGRGSS